jgi:hypothetical protein
MYRYPKINTLCLPLLNSCLKSNSGYKTMGKHLIILMGVFFVSLSCLAQHSDDRGRTILLPAYEDSLIHLGNKFINDENELERINANAMFIKTLVSALKVQNSFLYPFDSLKSVTIINSPDNRFRIISWHLQYEDGSYRFYGTVQINTGGGLKMFPLNDYSADIKNPEDTVADGRHWYGAQYYRIVPVYSPKLYYVLLGWKGYTVNSTKKVIEVMSFQDDQPVFGLNIFDGNGKSRKRVVFEYTRQASMLLKYDQDREVIVFDHLSPPDPKLKTQPSTFGPDLSYSGYKFKNGHWAYVEELDMRNLPESHDSQFVDPKKQAQIDKAASRKAN